MKKIIASIFVFVILYFLFVLPFVFVVFTTMAQPDIPPPPTSTPSNVVTQPYPPPILAMTQTPSEEVENFEIEDEESFTTYRVFYGHGGFLFEVELEEEGEATIIFFGSEQMSGSGEKIQWGFNISGQVYFFVVSDQEIENINITPITCHECVRIH